MRGSRPAGAIATRGAYLQQEEQDGQQDRGQGCGRRHHTASGKVAGYGFPITCNLSAAAVSLLGPSGVWAGVFGLAGAGAPRLSGLASRRLAGPAALPGGHALLPLIRQGVALGGPARPRLAYILLLLLVLQVPGPVRPPCKLAASRPRRRSPSATCT